MGFLSFLADLQIVLCIAGAVAGAAIAAVFVSALHDCALDAEGNA